ncbi:hypothetical protein GCM10027592_13850 [Spirosoma flavus]
MGYNPMESKPEQTPTKANKVLRIITITPTKLSTSLLMSEVDMDTPGIATAGMVVDKKRKAVDFFKC